MYNSAGLIVHCTLYVVHCTVEVDRVNTCRPWHYYLLLEKYTSIADCIEVPTDLNPIIATYIVPLYNLAYKRYRYNLYRYTLDSVVYNRRYIWDLYIYTIRPCSYRCIDIIYIQVLIEELLWVWLTLFYRIRCVPSHYSY